MPGGLRLICALASACLLIALLFADDSSPAVHVGPPKVKVNPVEDMVQGHKIVDPYRYLEDAANPDTQTYVRDQMAYTRSLLDPLPGRDKINARLEQLLTIGTIGAPQIGGNYYFYTRRDGQQNQPVLYVREGTDGADRALVDANRMSADGTVALDWWFPSETGKYVAYGTSPGGSEESTLHIIETATGKVLGDWIERTRFASVAWKNDDAGFYYTRHPRKGEVPPGDEVYYVKVFYHALGADPARDPLVFGEGRNAQDIPTVSLSEDDRWLLITVFEGWAKSEMYLLDLKTGTPPLELTAKKDFLYNAEVFKGKLYITTNEDAPRYRLFVAEATAPARDAWKEIIPQGEAVLQGAAVFGGKLFAQYGHNATSQLKLFDLDGKPVTDIAMPAIGSVFATGGRWDRDQAFFGFQSYTFPPSVYRYDLNDHKSSLWAKVNAPSIEPSAYEVNQAWYNSKDGTRVPMFVVHKKGLPRNGKNPALLTGYGGFNISMSPTFNRSAYLWLEHGGIYAVANLRGGSEFGEDWHRAGMLDKKQNVFDDFIAAAEFLISDKYTDKDHLAISGGSNGGL